MSAPRDDDHVLVLARVQRRLEFARAAAGEPERCLQGRALELELAGIARGLPTLVPGPKGVQ